MAAAVDLLETTIAEMQAGYSDGRFSAEAVVDQYLERIDAYDDDLNAILHVNENARDRAGALDERDGFVGPLHGIPVILKDNQNTHDMPTTAGSVALSDSQPARDAFVVNQLREAGAIVLAKANLQELSFGVDTISSLGGETHNAYDLDRRPSGSSGGTAAAVAANLCAIGTGSDTCSSVRSPPAFHALVGLRPTRGLLSRTGVVPLSETQDTVGPITRTVADAAIMLEVMAGYDPDDPVTSRGVGRIPPGGYTAQLDGATLDGVRIGVARQLFGGQEPRADRDTASVTRVVDDAIERMRAAGATIVDPVEIESVDYVKSARVIRYEFARDVATYLAELGEATRHSSLADIVETGLVTPHVEDRIRESGILDVDTDSVETNVGYLRRLRRRARLRDRTLGRMIEHDLDALLYPPSTVPPVRIPAHQPFEEMNCELAAHTGLPAIVLPAGYTDDGLPVGLELLGTPFAESRLLEVAHAFERVAGIRRPPAGFGPLE